MKLGMDIQLTALVWDNVFPATSGKSSSFSIFVGIPQNTKAHSQADLAKVCNQLLFFTFIVSAANLRRPSPIARVEQIFVRFVPVFRCQSTFDGSRDRSGFRRDVVLVLLIQEHEASRRRQFHCFVD